MCFGKAKGQKFIASKSPKVTPCCQVDTHAADLQKMATACGCLDNSNHNDNDDNIPNGIDSDECGTLKTTASCLRMNFTLAGVQNGHF